MNEATPGPDHSCDLLISAETAPVHSAVPDSAEVTIPALPGAVWPSDGA